MNAPESTPSALRPRVARLLDALPPQECGPYFLLDCNAFPADPALAEGIVLTRAGEAEARRLLSAGAPRVFLGEAALRDSTLVERLASAFGAERIGLYVPARRMEVSWSMDTVSNADFRMMTPSVCEPCLEILTADGLRTGTHASWWVGEMFERGASRVLLRADLADDADLNILAGLSEQWGERLWIAPLEAAEPDIQAWVELGGARSIAAPAAMIEGSAYLSALGQAPETEEVAKETG